MTEQEIDNTYLDQIKVPQEAYRVRYQGHATIADRNGISQPMYGNEGFAWRDHAWFKRFDESPDDHGSRDRYFFWMPEWKPQDKNIFIVYAGNLEFLD